MQRNSFQINYLRKNNQLKFYTGYKLNIMYKIAVTREEKNEVMLYWDNMRKVAAKIRDAYDKSNEDAFHRRYMAKFASKERPDFMEPLYKNNK